MKKLIILLIVMAISGCTARDARLKAIAERNAANEEKAVNVVEVRKEATINAILCGDEYYPRADDRISDAATIALAIARHCSQEYDLFVEAFVAAESYNKNLQHLVSVKLRSQSERVNFYLDTVLENRAKKLIPVPHE